MPEGKDRKRPRPMQPARNAEKNRIQNDRLGIEFFQQPVLTVARHSIGLILVRRTAEGVTAGRIVECEAYRGPEDLAAHSARGRRTPRTEVMFGPAGRAYMFLLYGMHWAFNFVVAGEGEPHAVLIRALEPVEGVELMAARRGLSPTLRTLTNGPGKLCRALRLDGADYGADLTSDAIHVLPGHAGPVGRSPRVNVDYAGSWAERPWRFYERNNPWVSTAPRT
jgi:DNA-3-methyladenine glycosylase